MTAMTEAETPPPGGAGGKSRAGSDRKPCRGAGRTSTRGGGRHPPADTQESAQAPEPAVPVVEAPAKLAATAPAEPWRRRALRALLYGSKVDRNVKARARVGLAILAFAVVYFIIAVRLIAFGIVSESRSGHRVGGGDAIATARPDILDRNGEVLATDVRVPSLYAEPRRLIDVDEAVELLTADLPDIDANELRERLSSKRGFVWLKRDITPEQQRAIYRQGLPGIGFLNENKRDYPSDNEASHVLGHVNIDNQGIAGMEKWLDGHGLAALHMAGLATDRLQNPVELSVDLRVQHALRDELVAARTKFKALAAAGIVLDVRTGEVVAMVSEPDYNPEQSARGFRPDPHQPADHRRVRDGLHVQSFHHRDGARFRQGDAQVVVRCAHAAAFRQIRYSRFPRAEPRADGPGNLHLFIEHRCGARGAGGRHRGAQGVPEKARPARPAAHRIAGERRADRAQALGRIEHDHHRLRPRSLGRAASGRDGRGGLGQRRHSHSADFPQALARPRRPRSASA